MNLNAVYSELVTLSEGTRTVLVGALERAAFQTLTDARHERKTVLTPRRHGELTRQAELYRRLAYGLRDSLTAS